MKRHLSFCYKIKKIQHRPMNVILYRKYVVPGFIENNKRVWDGVYMYDDRFFPNHTGPRSVPEFPNRPTHPLVNMGLAFWVNSITLCKGYVLWNNEYIYRPIYSTRREPYIHALLNEIRSVDVHKLAVWRRLDMSYVLLYQWRIERLRLRMQLPKEMIHEILDFLKF